MPNFDTVARGLEPVAAYQPVFELGRGGMGTVYLARAVGEGGFERLVVVKRLNRELWDQPDAIRRFLDEARHAAIIHHANVVGIQQIGKDQEGHFLVLDYVEGASLEELVDRAALKTERLPPPVVLRIGLDALAGLSAAHRAEDATGRPLGLLHRDVSLQNLIVGRDGVSRLADFGIAKSTLASVSTDHRYLVGKLLYSPPEYLARNPVGPTLDVYALGMTLWIAFSGTDPWPGADEAQLVAHICQDRIPTLAAIGVHIAPQVDDLLQKACEPDPLRRFASARDMANAIEAVGRSTGWLASHAEVSEVVERLVGVDLDRRRERIRTWVAEAGPPVASSMTHRSTPPPAPGRGAQEIGASDGNPMGVELPVTSMKAPAVAGAALVLAALGAAVWWRSARSEPTPAAPSAKPEMNASAAPAVSGTAPEISVVPLAPAASGRRDAAPARTPRSAGPRPLPLEHSSAVGRTADARSAAPSVPSAQPPHPPKSRAQPPDDDISKSNPYR